jgi:hypothetical protein
MLGGLVTLVTKITVRLVQLWLWLCRLRLCWWSGFSDESEIVFESEIVLEKGLAKQFLLAVYGG